MKFDISRKLKLFLYFVSFAEIFIFGYLADKTGNNVEMMLIALALLVLNFVIYKIAVKNKSQGKQDGV